LMRNDVQAAGARARMSMDGASLRRALRRWTLPACAVWLVAGCTANGHMEPVYLERGVRITVTGNELRRYRCTGRLAFVCQGTPGRLSRRECVCE
jgi:hypothetical protein